MSLWKRLALPSIGDVFFITIFSVALALGGTITQRDGDFAKHLSLGNTTITEGRLPAVDVYSHTMTGGEMVPHEWLAQATLAATERALGFDGIAVLFGIVAALPWVILYRWLVTRGTPVGRSLALSALGAAASIIHWATRPHIFTWLFVVLWVILLEDLRRGHRREVWVLIPLAIIWANTHGAFVVGFALLGTHLIGALIDRYLAERAPEPPDRARHLLFVLLGTVAASFVNPVGWKIVVHPFAHMGDDFLFQFTREFNSPDFHNALTWPFLVTILITIVLRFRWNATSLLLAAAFTAAGLYSFRHIPLYALVVIPIIGQSVSSWQPELRPSRVTQKLKNFSRVETAALGGSLSVLVLALTIFTLAQTPGSDFSFGNGFFPVDAVETIADDPPGERVFNQFVWGGYLVFCCHPEIPVFIDGQTDYYGPELTQEYDTAIRGRPGWQEVFEKYDIDWALIAPDTGLAQVLIESDEWVESYRDSTAVVFVPAG